MMLNPFIEKFSGIVEYAKVYVGLRSKEVKELLEEVAIKCLEVSCKGKMLKRLVESYPALKGTIATLVVEKYQLDLDDLPCHEDEDACRAYEASLCRDYCFPKSRAVEPSVDAQDGGGGDDVVMRDENGGSGDEEQDELDDLSDGEEEIKADGPELVSYLGLSSGGYSSIWYLIGSNRTRLAVYNDTSRRDVEQVLQTKIVLRIQLYRDNG